MHESQHLTCEQEGILGLQHLRMICLQAQRLSQLKILNDVMLLMSVHSTRLTPDMQTRKQYVKYVVSHGIHGVNASDCILMDMLPTSCLQTAGMAPFRDPTTSQKLLTETHNARQPPSV